MQRIRKRVLPLGPDTFVSSVSWCSYLLQSTPPSVTIVTDPQRIAKEGVLNPGRRPSCTMVIASIGFSRKSDQKLDENRFSVTEHRALGRAIISSEGQRLSVGGIESEIPRDDSNHSRFLSMAGGISFFVPFGWQHHPPGAGERPPPSPFSVSPFLR